MNHASICAHESERLYRIRSNILPKLDAATFTILNRGAHVLGMNGYCLDALDELPSGGMGSFVTWPSQLHTVRGLTARELAARRAIVEKMIAELLAEEPLP